MQDTCAQLTAIEAELTKQDAEWADAHAQLLALGDVELSLDPDVLVELAALRSDSTAVPLHTNFHSRA